jgi:hypothetical protein
MTSGVASLRAKPIIQIGAYETAVIPVSRFPVPDPEAEQHQDFLAQILGQLGGEELHSSVFLQLEQMHEAASRITFAEHAAELMPEVGLGVWPDRKPPATWTVEEFQKTVPGAKPRPLMNQVFCVTNPVAAKKARASFYQIGCLVEFLTPFPTATLLQRTLDQFVSGIKDPSTSCYPFYIPLLEAKTVATADEAALQQWLCGAKLYWRQSFEDQGTIIAYRGSLRSLFQQLEGKEEKGMWWFSS